MAVKVLDIPDPRGAAYLFGEPVEGPPGKVGDKPYRYEVVGFALTSDDDGEVVEWAEIDIEGIGVRIITTDNLAARTLSTSEMAAKGLIRATRA